MIFILFLQSNQPCFYMVIYRYSEIPIQKGDTMTDYSLTVSNDSLNDVRFAMFQEAPTPQPGQNIFTLAWFSKYAYKNASATFTWSITYSALWSRPGQVLKPGVVCGTGQQLSVDLDGLNSVTLSYDASNDAFHFGDVTKGSPGGVITNCDSSVPNSLTTPSAACGIGIAMSGAGTFLADTQPNINMTWTPKPKYYLIAGNFEVGEILDVQTLMGSALEIPYEGIYKQTAALQKDNMLKLGS
jgi:rhizosphere induced protein